VDSLSIIHRVFFIFLELAKGETSKERKQLIEKAKKIHEQIARWAKNGVLDCCHMLKFTEAQMTLANTDSKPSVRKVKTLFNDAIAAAARDEFLHHEAHANEPA
jgi:ribosome recycling factor